MESPVCPKALRDNPNTISSYEHALYSPDLPSPQSALLMYEDEPDTSDQAKKCIFEFPQPTEISDLGGELNNSFWSEEILTETSFGDGSKVPLWDFSGFDDISNPLQHPDDDLSYTPTLAELNNEDSMSFDAMLSSHNACVAPTTKLKPQCHRSNVGNPPKMEPKEVKPLQSKTNSLDCWSGTNKATIPVDISVVKLEDTETEVQKTSCIVQQNVQTAEQVGQETNRCRGSKRKLNVELKWQKIQSLIHDDELSRSCAVKQMKKSLRCVPAKAKKFISKDVLVQHRLYTTQNGGGYDSHDEGLGSENEDQDEEDDISEEDEEASSDEELHHDQDEEDACSDMSDDQDIAETRGRPYHFPLKVKSRRSEYDDLTPNPKRLLHIGNELHKLNKIISGMTPVSALPINARNRCRKEKNKLASRACRLKKKAQHEANKVKLFGLDKEHDRLMQVITAIRKEIAAFLQEEPKQESHLTQHLNSLIKDILGQMIANHTQEFINNILEKMTNVKSTGASNFQLYLE